MFFLTINIVCKFLRFFTVQIFNKVETTIDVNGQEIYCTNTQQGSQ